MKKALIIAVVAHNTIGGTQNYSIKLINILKKMNYEVTEYSCDLLFENPNGELIGGVETIRNSSIPKNTSNLFYKGFIYQQQLKKSTKELGQLILKNNYDIIIDFRQTLDKNEKQAIPTENKVWVQHVSPGVLEGRHITNKFLEPFTIMYFKNKNILYNQKNMILFDKENLNYLDKNKINTKNIDLIPLSHKINFEEMNGKIEFLDRKFEIGYIGRIENQQKNISFLINSSKYINAEMNFWGKGNEKLIEKIKSSSFTKYNGFFNQNKVDGVMENMKFMVICSTYEGSCYSIIQAISHGVIPIVLNTFPSAEFLTQFGFLLDKNIKKKDFAKEINKIMKMDPKELVKLSNQNIEFFKQYLSEEQFVKSWENVINKYSK